MRTETIAGRYELVEELSSGGMGTVWRGYDSVLDREVAVKLIRPDVIFSRTHGEELAQRFRREARVTARIRHTGIPAVYDAVLGGSYERLYLVMELVEGTPLRAFVDSPRPLPIAWAPALGAQIATVLSHAHAVPVVHRDLKPDNVLVASDGAVRVLDFGVAAILRTGVTRLTASGQPVGTSKYMSPEQVAAARVSPRSDLYALGCVLHEVLSGRPVFDGGTDFELMRQHVEEPPKPLCELRADVPAAVEGLVLELLAKTPDGRPADAVEVYDRLMPFLPMPGSTPPVDEHTPTGMPDPTLVYRHPNAPHPRPETPTLVTGSETAQPGAPPPAPDADLRDAIRAASECARALLDEGRYAQAAEALAVIIERASTALGAESSRMLGLRAWRAAILVLGGDARRALPEFDALAAAYARTEGASSPDSLDCLEQAAHCRAELGEVTTAIGQFREVLAQRRANDGDASPTALDLRRNIGTLLASEGRIAEAQQVLQPLYDDLCVVYGQDHEESEEVHGLLARLRFAAG